MSVVIITFTIINIVQSDSPVHATVLFALYIYICMCTIIKTTIVSFLWLEHCQNTIIINCHTMSISLVLVHVGMYMVLILQSKGLCDNDVDI